MTTTRDPLFMTRFVTSIRIVLTFALTGVVVFAICVTTGSTASAIPTAGTALPPAWELCILQGLNAPATQANVANLDEWQAAEGGSTNNTAAYNPFNTGRTTDATGAPLPGVASANGFPAFSDWLSGCSATVATLLQPNMVSITTALRTGNVSPPPAFLAAVDQSQWCAPSADGTPCYADAILGAAGNVATDLLSQSSALEVYGNVRSDVHDYQQSLATVLADQGLLASRQQQYAAAQSAVSAAKDRFASAKHQLQSVAVDEYVSNGLYVSGSYVNPRSRATPFGPPSAEGVIALQYQTIVANDLVARFQTAETNVKAAESSRDDAAHALTQATTTFASDDAAEKRSLTRLVADVATMQKAGACTTAQVVTPVAGAAPAGSTVATATPNQSSSNTPTTTTTTTPTVASTSTLPGGISGIPTDRTPRTTTTTTATTTTTTVSSSSTTSTTTTTTAPPRPSGPSNSTSTSTSTSTTTTTTTVPGSTGAAVGSQASVNPAGLTVLQGCVATLAPTASA